MRKLKLFENFIDDILSKSDPKKPIIIEVKDISPVLIPAGIIVIGFLLAPVYLVFTALWSAVLNRKC